jgi:4-hydroxybenzoate polyprenyltransferase
MDGAEDLTFAGASADALGGAAAAGGGAASIALAALALSLFYLGGMWLNDAFDAEVDARERADRPIPRGEIARGTVFAIGFAMLAGGVALAAMLGPGPGAAGALLAVAVILYDWLHKRMATAPLLMGAARMLSYGVAALAVGALTGAVLGGAAGLFAYVVGLTFAARQEALDRLEGVWPLAVLAVPVLYAGWRVQGAEDPLGAVLLLGLLAVMVWALWLLFRRRRGDVPRAVDTLIGGIALYDAVLLAAAGYPGAAALAAGAFALTLALQRWVPGT